MKQAIDWQKDATLIYRLETTADFKNGGLYGVESNDGEYISVRFSDAENAARFSIDVAHEVFDFIQD